MKNLLLKLKESAISVVPITVIVLILGLTMADISTDLIISFVIGSLFIIIGMGVFSLGSDVAMVPIGSYVGSSMTRTKKLGIIALTCFILGVIVTVAEPDLIVLANQLSEALNKTAFIITVGVGVGLVLVLALLRIVFQISFRTVMIVLYAIAFILAFFVSDKIMPLAFDSGAVTTGPILVPFIMALGIGISSAMGGKTEDSFGFVAFTLIGPIIAILIFGFFIDTSALKSDAFLLEINDTGMIFMPFLYAIPSMMMDVAVALLPILGFFLIYNFASLKLPKKTIIKILVGMVYVYIGLVLFLVGVSVGFAPVGNLLGQGIVLKGLEMTLIPIGLVIGFFIVAAEPAVHVLNEQVEEISGGTIKKKSMMISLMIAVAGSIALAMLRVLTGINLLWIIVPGYTLAIILSFFVPKVFTSIAFDSGAVASGPMAATFILPFTVGASMAKGSNIFTDAFGVVILVSMTPLLTVQIMGLIAKIKADKLAKVGIKVEVGKISEGETEEEHVIDFDDEENGGAGSDKLENLEPFIDTDKEKEEDATTIEEFSDKKADTTSKDEENGNRGKDS